VGSYAKRLCGSATLGVTVFSRLKSHFEKRRLAGHHAENLAYAYLVKKGLRLIKRNYHCRQGEIDLIMQEAQTIVFVEVRYRAQSDFGSSAESVDHHKQKKIILCAQYFLHNYPIYQQMACRFDVVALYPNVQDPAQWHTNWIPHAFDASTS
jgi:putative endonuclease